MSVCGGLFGGGLLNKDVSCISSDNKDTNMSL